MAGEGGFSTKPMGFDRNEVNEYISNLRKKMNEIEADKKLNEEKTRAAVKAAEEADGKVQAAKKECEDRIAEFEVQLRNERRIAEQLQDQVDELKRKLKNSSSQSSHAAAEAEKKAAAIIERANSEARDVVEKAKHTAHEIISSASGVAGSAASSANSEELLSALRSFTDSISSELKTLNEKALSLLGTSSGSVEMPDLSAYTAPQAAVSQPKAAPAPVSSEKAPSVPAPAAPAPKDDPADAFGIDLFSNSMGDDDMDLSAFGEIDDGIKPLEPEKTRSEVIDGFDLSDVGKPTAEEQMVSEVEPLDGKPKGAEIVDGFDMDLIAQTVPSSSLTSDMGSDLLDAVAKENDKHAVQPSDGMGTFDMDMDSSSSGSLDDGIDAMNALLGQMGAALESAGGSVNNSDLDMDSGMDMGISSDEGTSQWADLQAELNAMVQNGGLGEETPANDQTANLSDDRKVPDADDSSIWNFGGDTSADFSDDDMSADLFGSF